MAEVATAVNQASNARRRQALRSKGPDLLLSEAAPGERVNLSFLGGEPLVIRSV
jgi:hypothetical protein